MYKGAVMWNHLPPEQRNIPLFTHFKYLQKKEMLAMNTTQARIQDFLQGGGVNDGRVLRAPLPPAPTGGLGLINIKLRYIASIEYSERFLLLFFFCYS